MTLPTTEQVMSMYLYGQDTKPDLDALLRGDFIRPENAPNTTLQINVADYIKNGVRDTFFRERFSGTAFE